MARAGQREGGHNDMRLHNILETYPRDELFQIGEDELLKIALGVLHLSDRPRVKLFVRRDPSRPLHLDPALSAARTLRRGAARRASARMLAQAFGGHVSAYYPSFSDAPLARVHYIIGVEPGAHLEPDDIAARGGDRPGRAHLGVDASRRRCAPSGRRAQAAALLARYGPASRPATATATPRRGAGRPRRHARAGPDRRSPSAPSARPAIRRAASASSSTTEGRAARAGRRAADPRQHGPEGAGRGRLRARPAGRRAGAVGLGARVRARRPARRAARLRGRATARSRQAFLAVWSGQAENDGFNRLVLRARRRPGARPP